MTNRTKYDSLSSSITVILGLALELFGVQPLTKVKLKNEVRDFGLWLIVINRAMMVVIFKRYRTAYHD